MTDLFIIIVKFWILIFKLLKEIAKYCHIFSEWVAELFKKLLSKLGSKLGNHDLATRKKYLFISQIIQIAIVAIAFIVSSDKFGLFCNVLYTTPPGFALGIVTMVNENNNNDGFSTIAILFTDLGDSIVWITVGIQSILLEGYSEILDRYTEKKFLKMLSKVLFIYTTGVLLTEIISFCPKLLASLENLPILYGIIIILLVVILIALFIIALDAVISNIAVFFLILPIAGILIILNEYSTIIFPWLHDSIMFILLTSVVKVISLIFPEIYNMSDSEIFILIGLTYMTMSYFIAMKINKIIEFFKEKAKNSES